MSLILFIFLEPLGRPRGLFFDTQLDFLAPGLFLAPGGRPTLLLILTVPELIFSSVGLPFGDWFGRRIGLTTTLVGRMSAMSIIGLRTNCSSLVVGKSTFLKGGGFDSFRCYHYGNIVSPNLRNGGGNSIVKSTDSIGPKGYAKRFGGGGPSKHVEF